MMNFLCPHTNHKLEIWQFSDNFLIEPKLRILYYTKWRPLLYDDNYFLDEYKKTYGKTYLEDEPNIRILAKKRLQFLKPYLTHHTSLLEIGCATGFFLDEAKKYFKLLKGIEISSFASEYAKNKFLLDVECCNLMDFIKYNNNKFDVIATFYVIEHFKEQKEIFNFISNTLKPKGLWICSIPSTNGPFFMHHKEEWIKTHPEDHFVDYNPYAIKKILMLYGLKLLFIKPASYHQQRNKGILKKIPFSLYKLYCDMFTFGDTIEFIAIKI
ncbi:MAG: 2-polyprenyl-3-methyl-5-hydroxy-6-metoxy-1,4-benzoquinol methylase [Leptospiraceae bacterium]|nr:MAG: 2-polyprenyl-3-methyl-5-hydroxy-6-metoxy-1,4-benzoquinol methylase [Leptospiraceae bacterium]